MQEGEEAFPGIEDTVGKTPLVRLKRLTAGLRATVLVKLESYNPGFSVKDRIALSMIEDAEKAGKIHPETTVLIEPTSGNTGIGLAFVAAARGYKLVLTMPATASQERRVIMAAFGAQLVLTPAEYGMRGAIAKAEELARCTPGAVILQQFENPSNPEIHYRTTGPEIWEATGGNIDVFVAGVGTGGTITGAGRFLRERNPNLKVFAVEPSESPVLAGGTAAPHLIQGIGAGFVPKVYDPTVVNGGIEHVTGPEAIEYSRRMAREEGILCGISSGAAVLAALRVAARPEFSGKVIVCILPDSGERYLTTALFNKFRVESERAPIAQFVLDESGKIVPPAPNEMRNAPSSSKKE